MTTPLTSRFPFFFFFIEEDGIRDFHVTGVQTCALTIWPDEHNRVGGYTGPAGRRRPRPHPKDRKSVVEGKSVDLRGRRIIKQKKIKEKKDGKVMVDIVRLQNGIPETSEVD